MLRPEQLETVIHRYTQKDPELYEELKSDLHDTAQITERMARSLRMEPGLEAANFEMLESLGIDSERVAETIVRPKARPVMTIRDNRATTQFLGPDSQVWAGRIAQAQAVLDRVIPAVGRVEVLNNPDFDWVGTGWLVDEDVIVTNRHVALEFCRRSGSAFSFRMGSDGGAMSSRIDFLEEHQRAASLEYSIGSILFIAPLDGPDVAFFRVRRRPSDLPLAKPIALSTVDFPDDFVATIGYPARDSRVPDQDLVLRLFGDVYDKKRLAPGQLIDVTANEVLHDCSTLGGNSGSALVNLRTGEAVGLHFSGLFMQANFAVPAKTVGALLQRARQAEATPAVISPLPPRNHARPAVALPSQVSAETPASLVTVKIPIEIEITLKIGTSVVSTATSQTITSPPVTQTDPPPAAGGADDLETALEAARALLSGNPNIVEIRAGYRFLRGWITDERVVVVEVRDGEESVAAGAGESIPRAFGSVGVDIRTAGLGRQLESFGIDLSLLEARSRSGLYREPENLPLKRVRESMKAIFHVSPDSGFPNLKAFFGRVERHLTATMFEWSKNHISDALEAAIRPPGRTLKMVTQRAGTRDAVDDMKMRLREKFQDVSASVGSGKLIPSSYHIKVASRDDREFWLSSGNWKDSNQADIDPAGENSDRLTFLNNHNREWHAIIENPTLAQLFRRYIEFDFEEAQRVPVAEGREVELPEFFVPEEPISETLERVRRVEYADPLVLDRELDVQPLLTPDRDDRNRRVFLLHALQMIKRAERKIYLQNQSFNLLAEDDNNDEFLEFFETLRDRQQAGLDVRIIFRDAREFGLSGARGQQQLLERLKEFGFDTRKLKLQERCHTKGIIIDAKEVLLGSHNLTNQGSLFNRDASLLVRDAEVAAYFEKIFLFDWEVLAKQEAEERPVELRRAGRDEATPAGFRRVSIIELVGLL